MLFIILQHLLVCFFFLLLTRTLHMRRLNSALQIFES